MSKIAEQITKIIGDTEKDFNGETNYEELKEADKEYNKLIELGIVKKRGYNLLSIDQIDTKQSAFNSL